MTACLTASLLFFGPHHTFDLYGGFSSRTSIVLAPVFSFPALSYLPCHYSSVRYGCRNLNLLSIGYAFLPRLRPRLTQGRSALPWKPWIFGRKDSHLSLATHSGILSSYPSTALYSTASSVLRMLLYHSLRSPQLRCRVSAPDIFGAGTLD